MNIKTYYDKTLKQKCYMVHGDESYANTTDTLISYDPSSFDDSTVAYFTYTFSVDVLREIDVTGDSAYVEIYDNDEIVKTIDWISDITDENRTFDLNLAYDIEHNIKARFGGNKLCLPSHSQVIKLFEETPSRFETSLAFTSLNHSWETDSSNNIQVTLTSSSTVSGQDIKLYIDENIYGTSTTNSNGVATFSNVSGLEDGIHYLYAEFGGDEQSSPSTVSDRISVGFIVRVDTYNASLLNGSSLSVTVTVFNQYGYTPASLSSATASVYSDNTKISNDVTLSNGKATITVANSSLSPKIVNNVLDWEVRVVTSSNKTYKSNAYQTQFYTPTSISFETTKAVVGAEQSSTLRGLVGGVSNGLRVTLSGAMSRNLTTNKNGEFSVSYTGTGTGSKTVTATCGSLSKSITFDDVLQYWDTTSQSINKSYMVINPNFLELTNGFKLSPQTGHAQIGVGYGKAWEDDGWQLSFNVVNSNGSFTFTVGDWYMAGGQVVVNNVPVTDLSLKQGQVVSIRYDGYISVYVNNTLIEEDIGYDGGYPVFGITGASVGSYLTFDKLKFVKSEL